MKNLPSGFTDSSSSPAAVRPSPAAQAHTPEENRERREDERRRRSLPNNAERGTDAVMPEGAMQREGAAGVGEGAMEQRCST
ncbi:hypothetical protein EJ110_NYTH05314 [Nymphaea thermarum]|nr:hypothetical protein EJ110_NYTH05314 [Nymphaea thermarum]